MRDTFAADPGCECVLPKAQFAVLAELYEKLTKPTFTAADLGNYIDKHFKVVLGPGHPKDTLQRLALTGVPKYVSFIIFIHRSERIALRFEKETEFLNTDNTTNIKRTNEILAKNAKTFIKAKNNDKTTKSLSELVDKFFGDQDYSLHRLLTDFERIFIESDPENKGYKHYKRELYSNMLEKKSWKEIIKNILQCPKRGTVGVALKNINDDTMTGRWLELAFYAMLEGTNSCV